VQLILLLREAPRQECGHLLGSAATEMRNQQKNPGTFSHGLFHKKFRGFSTKK
jgi:hypothetical protein